MFHSLLNSDALEEEREKNNRLADMLETLRRQHSSLESEVGRSEVMRRERESAENRFIKVSSHLVLVTSFVLGWMVKIVIFDILGASSSWHSQPPWRDLSGRAPFRTKCIGHVVIAVSAWYLALLEDARWTSVL